ncbi:uncharacterized protein H6S33_003304 [Morchella sextelata]|uniref:uncharacterized protein n=1 Tax=Morchella sextelata TaxID=1174677 RepID=UPI001D0371BF|nr:uncharacterized protein H6S33_003304 [Morchella sextelata]KAH0607316.1 hypothetical protein H6S33_003304 [Morchella sextelata]
MLFDIFLLLKITKYLIGGKGGSLNRGLDLHASFYLLQGVTLASTVMPTLVFVSIALRNSTHNTPPALFFRTRSTYG